MKDYLDSDEFTRSFVAVMDAYEAMEGPGFFSAQKTIDLDNAVTKLKREIREHFLPKNNQTYERICDCLPGIDGELREDDYDKLRKFVLGEE